MSLTSKQIDELRAYAKDRKGELAKLINDAADTIEMLSAKLSAANIERSSQYYHGGWIPCSERLPEDSQFVLMTIRRMGEHYNHEPFISVGYISWNQSVWWCAHDGDCKSYDVRVDAWMPLPECYRGENDG
jgi:hypothetical protein